MKAAPSLRQRSSCRLPAPKFLVTRSQLPSPSDSDPFPKFPPVMHLFSLAALSFLNRSASDDSRTHKNPSFSTQFLYQVCQNYPACRSASYLSPEHAAIIGIDFKY